VRRLNITMPENVAKKLTKIKNKSCFIVQAIEEKMKRDEMEKLKNELIEGYKAMSDEEYREEIEVWDCVIGDGLD